MKSSQSRHGPEVDESLAQHVSTPVRPKRVSRPTEPIEEASQEDDYDPDEMLFETHQQAENLSEEIPVVKRQRADDPDERVMPQRFVFAPITPSQISTPPFSAGDIVSSTKPAFRLLPPEPPGPSEPLPNAFSPHRRGQRFVPGGMAAEAQQWVVEVAQSIGQQRGASSSGNTVHASVLEIEDEPADGMILLRAQSDHGALNLLLPTSRTSSTFPSLRKGDDLAIKAPTWQARIAEDYWVVAADWRQMP